MLDVFQNMQKTIDTQMDFIDALSKTNAELGIENLRLTQEKGDRGMHVSHPCINCKQDKFGMTQLPYPSEHDGDYLCNECLAEIVDTALGVRSGRYLVIS